MLQNNANLTDDPNATIQLFQTNAKLSNDDQEGTRKCMYYNGV